MNRHIDKWNLLIIFLTFILFFLALFIKGFTKDLLLEAAILLVSVKIILATYKHHLDLIDIKSQLDRIEEKIGKV